MKAARFYDKGNIWFEDIPESTIEPGLVGIDVAWCGICGTDLDEFMDGPIFIPPCGHPHPVSGDSAPILMGHEFSGVVYAVSDGLSEKIAVKRRWVHPISNAIPLDQAALIEPLTVGYHAFVRSGAKAGDIALIGSGGPVGLLLAAVLKAKGITVILTELSAKRKEKAKETGVSDYVLDPSEVNVAEEVMRITENRGVDVAFKCTSVNEVLDILVETTKPSGTVVIVSIWSHPATVNVHSVVMKELDVRGTIAYANNHEETIKLVEEGKVNLEPFITQRIKLDDLVAEGFERLIHNNESAVKIIVHP
ncbi:butanediol dehydrogenase [Glaciecola punicea]|jgi:(R,R)-butanediol dehydrogenase/meso-butanediol dehydrogenase/diacetyl reductase|uniref:2,3-butanediol dehydrogenase n=1 Tax=Glaciecola punicea TaxID=56804 RepID=UPI0008734CF4|nr:2,3-butanediol dehydrogenase [Glaciecola punicea]OFA31160.1 butanediol dehydrogenase [Glaciecola punicea]